jgi:transposase
VFGLTCAKYQSGEVDWDGRISRCGDEMMRTMLYEAAQAMMRSKKWSWLKAWAMQDLLHHHQHPSSSFGGDAAGNADLPDRASYD